MDTNHIYCWTAKFLLENPAVDWNHSGWTKFPPCWLLLNEPLPTPPNLPLWPIKKPPSVCPAALDSTPPLSCWLPEKPRKSPGRKEASVCLWKRTICVSGKFYNSCAAKHVHSKAEQPPSPRSCRPRDYSILLKRKKGQKMQSTSLFLAIIFSLSLSLKFVQGDGELFCQNLNRKTNK